MKRTTLFVALVFACMHLATAVESTTVTQYGVTWTFAEARPVGQFVTGDWWVVGPVRVVSVSPEPGPAEAKGKKVQSRYGATGMVEDARLRNGSMIIAQASGKQGYDSRLVNFDPEQTVTYPVDIVAGQSLISTISTTKAPVDVLLKDIMWKSEASGTAALQSAAVLTCVDAAPAKDAFRPPYAGSDRTVWRVADLKWDRLPRLAPAGEVPDWAMVERWFERPWLDHISSWVFQLTGPVDNQPNYGREFCRATSLASLMLMLDVPEERKRTLLIRFVQRGIDTYGLIKAGRRWSGDGGHWNGRKWPLLFAGIVLDDQRLVDAVGEGIFSEDQQTYFGRGFDGSTALYQIVNHTGVKPPYEEKDPKTWTDHDKRSNSYRKVCSMGWPGLALSAQLMKAKAAWNHDAFFAYCDRWMADPDASGMRCDAFVQAMWDAHRPGVPDQAGAKDSRKWHWEKKVFEPNPIPK